MDRGIPISNKLVSKRMNDRSRMIHLNKLNTIKSSINCQAPQKFAHLQPASKKKNKFNDDRATEIEKENRALLEKLTSIMQSNNLPRGHDKYGKSLNHDYRKRELVKITIENEAFLKRLQEQRPTYNQQAWEHEYKKSKLYLKNICEFPVVAPGTTKMRLNEDGELEVDREMYKSFNSTRNPIAPNSSVSKSQTNTHRFNQTLSKLKPVKKQNTEKLDPIEDNGAKKMLYNTKRKLGLGTYLIHIYMHNDTFNIIASNNDRSDFKTFSVSREEGEDLIRSYNEDYEQLVNQIKFKGSKIILGSEQEESPGLSNIEENSTEKQEEQGIVIIENNKTKADSVKSQEIKVEEPKTQPNSAGTEEAPAKEKVPEVAVTEVPVADQKEEVQEKEEEVVKAQEVPEVKKEEEKPVVTIEKAEEIAKEEAKEEAAVGSVKEAEKEKSVDKKQEVEENAEKAEEEVGSPEFKEEEIAESRKSANEESAGLKEPQNEGELGPEEEVISAEY